MNRNRSGGSMKRLLPDRTEIMIFAAMAVVCSVIVACLPARDLGLSALAMPLFVTAAMMGVRRNGQLGAGERNSSDAE